MVLIINPPKLNLETKRYEIYKQELFAWREVTDWDKKKQGIVIALSLPENDDNKIKENVFEQLTIEELKKEDGFDILIKFLDKHLSKDDLTDSLEKYEDFDEFQRLEGQNINEFVSMFDAKYRRMEKKNMKLPTDILAFRLLRKANITKEEKMLVLTGMNYENKNTLYEEAKQSLKKFKGDMCDSGTRDSSRKNVIFDEANLAESKEVLLAAGYIKAEQRNLFNNRRGVGWNCGGYGRAYNGFQRTTTNSKVSSTLYKKKNPFGADGRILKCKSCGSFRHLLAACPDSWENISKVNMTEDQQVVLFTGHNMNDIAQMDSSVCNSAILDSACSSTVCGRHWISSYIKSLNQSDRYKIRHSSGFKMFSFGGGTRLKSSGEYIIPAVIAGKEVTIKTDVVDSDIPLLLSRTAMKNAGIKMDLENDTAKIFGQDVALNVTLSGHYCIPVGKTDQIPVETICAVKLGDKGENRVDEGENRVEECDSRVDKGDDRVDEGEDRVEGDNRVDKGGNKVEEGENRVDEGEHRVDEGEDRVDEGEHRVEEGKDRVDTAGNIVEDGNDGDDKGKNTADDDRSRILLKAAATKTDGTGTQTVTSDRPVKKKGYVNVVYEYPTAPGEKKDTSCPLPQAYSPQYTEAAWYDWWVKQGYFTPSEQETEGKEKFILCLPPPNVTGTLHLGHALTCSIQDAIVRWHHMNGRDTLWVPGCDHAGIATQVVVERKLWQERKLTRHDLGREEFLKEVWKWKNEKGDTIYQQMRKLGASLDWSRAAFTMDESMSKAVTEAFVRLHDEGLIYRSNRLINWCCNLKSTISDMEVENQSIEGKTYLDVPGYDRPVQFGTMMTFAYPIADSDDKITVSTTRLETMLGDSAVAVNPDDPRYSHLIGRYVLHPLNDRKLPIVCDSVVQKDFGTGAVKITPAHDPVDFDVGTRHNLPFYNIIDDAGYMENVPVQFIGEKRFHARLKVRDALKDKGLFIGTEEHSMVIPRCSRSRDIIEPRIKPQWFLNSADIGKQTLDAVQSGEVSITPEFYAKIWQEWFKTSVDWNISRQLWWGHRIPAYRVTHPTLDPTEEVWVSGRSENEAREKATAMLGVGDAGLILQQDEDVLDTWFSSALFPFSVHGWPDKTADMSRFYPSSLLETGSDIVFFWVARMVMMGLLLTKQLPFSQVLLHGILRDAHGRKMSKSLGNIIDPLDVIRGISLEGLHQKVKDTITDKAEAKRAIKGQKVMFEKGIPECGTDALRFSLCSMEFKSPEINMDIKEVQNYRHFCNKIWQAYQFVSGNLGDNFVPMDDISDISTADSLDAWILSRLSHVVRSCDQHFGSHDINHVTKVLYLFWFQDFCDVYLEYVKPVFLSDDEVKQKNTQNILHLVMDTYLRVLCPFMPYLCEELYQQLPPRGDNKAESICVAEYPQPSQYVWSNTRLDQDMQVVCGVGSAIMSLAEAFQLKRKDVHAYVKVPSKDRFDMLSEYHSALSILTRAGSVSIVTDVCDIPEMSTSKSHGDNIDVHVPLQGLINVGREVEKLNKKRVKLQQKREQREVALRAEKPNEEIMDAKITKIDAELGYIDETILLLKLMENQ